MKFNAILKDGTEILFTASPEDMPAGPEFYVANRFDVLLWDISEVRPVTASSDFRQENYSRPIDPRADISKIEAYKQPTANRKATR